MPTAKGPPIAEGRTAQIFAWGEDQILKLYRTGYRAGDAAREATSAQAAHEVGLKTPAVIDVVIVEGRQGIIYERVDGPTMLQVLMADPTQLISLAQLTAELHAALHRYTTANLPLLRPRLKRRIEAVSELAEETKASVLAVLAHLPDDTAICHGDFHPANILMTTRGPVLIDWVDATQGHPLADIARTSLLLRLGALPSNLSQDVRRQIIQMRHLFLETYLKHYLQSRSILAEEIAQWELPVAAARLAEGIVEENQALLSLIETALAD